MNYLVIDLEMCRVPYLYRQRGYKYAYETIQIGAALLDEEYKIIGTIRQYIHPEYGVIDDYIAKLTGIKNADVKNAPKLEEGLGSILDWLGNREYRIIAWSGTDLQQLEHEILTKDISDDRLYSFIEEEKWIDYQKVFSDRFAFESSVGLQAALVQCRIEPDGTFHDGLYDAINTAKLIEKMEMNPDYELYNYMDELEEAEQPLTLSLGSIFGKLNLQFSA